MSSAAEGPLTHSSPLRLAILLGSTRDGRFGGTVAQWFRELAEQHPSFSVDVIDLAEVELPTVQSAAHPKAGRYPDRVQPFARRIAAADAYVLVTPEYNHGYPAALKLALDSVYAEWNAKPASFVTYGGASGGIRAAEQLRQVLAELHVATIRDAVALPFARRSFDEDGALIDEGRVSTAAKTMLDQLAWWGQALRDGRERAAYPF